MLDFISDTDHFTRVLFLASKAKQTLWIGNADIKDLYVLQGKIEQPFLGVLSDLIGKGVEVRLIHAKPNTKYVIIDDEYVILDSQQSNFILTNPYAGITDEDADRVISILNR